MTQALIYTAKLHFRVSHKEIKICSDVYYMPMAKKPVQKVLTCT